MIGLTKNLIQETLEEYPGEVFAVKGNNLDFSVSLDNSYYFCKFINNSTFEVENFVYKNAQEISEVIKLNESFAKKLVCNKIEFKKFEEDFNEILLSQNYKKGEDSYFKSLS